MRQTVVHRREVNQEENCCITSPETTSRCSVDIGWNLRAGIGAAFVLRHTVTRPPNCGASSAMSTDLGRVQSIWRYTKSSAVSRIEGMSCYDFVRKLRNLVETRGFVETLKSARPRSTAIGAENIMRLTQSFEEPVSVGQIRSRPTFVVFQRTPRRTVVQVPRLRQVHEL